MSNFGLAKPLKLLDEYDTATDSDNEPEYLDSNEENDQITVHIYDNDTLPSSVVEGFEEDYQLDFGAAESISDNNNNNKQQINEEAHPTAEYIAIKVTEPESRTDLIQEEATEIQENKSR